MTGNPESWQCLSWRGAASRNAAALTYEFFEDGNYTGKLGRTVALVASGASPIFLRSLIRVLTSEALSLLMME